MESQACAVRSEEGAGGGVGRGWRERANVFIRFSGWAVKAHASGRKAVGSGEGAGKGPCACAGRAGSSGRAWRGLLEEKPGKREAEGKEGRGEGVRARYAHACEG